MAKQIQFSISPEKAQKFSDELKALRMEIDRSLSDRDYRHLLKIIWWGRISTLVGYATAWILPNPFSIFLMSMGNFNRWIMNHHISHKGYDRVPGIPLKYTSKVFSRGYRRFIDWFDWISPECWHYEHNVLHHYNTGEEADPDFVQRNLEPLRASSLPTPLKLGIVFYFMLTWKIVYYSPTTFSYFQVFKNNKTKNKKNHKEIAGFLKLISPISYNSLLFWKECLIPYSIFRFILVPLCFLPLGKTPALYVLINSILAELLTNMHSFIAIVPNHAGKDIYSFTRPAQSQVEFQIRQILGSVNYTSGSDWSDFLHGWLNYQIEHHLWPDIPMLKYREFQPAVKALCQKYEIPYIQQSVFSRLLQLFEIMIGNSSNMSVPEIISCEK